VCEKIDRITTVNVLDNNIYFVAELFSSNFFLRITHPKKQIFYAIRKYNSRGFRGIWGYTILFSYLNELVDYSLINRSILHSSHAIVEVGIKVILSCMYQLGNKQTKQYSYFRTIIFTTLSFFSHALQIYQNILVRYLSRGHP
jgi:hypothetical protein